MTLEILKEENPELYTFIEKLEIMNDTDIFNEIFNKTTDEDIYEALRDVEYFMFSLKVRYDEFRDLREFARNCVPDPFRIALLESNLLWSSKYCLEKN